MNDVVNGTYIAQLETRLTGLSFLLSERPHSREVDRKRTGAYPPMSAVPEAGHRHRQQDPSPMREALPVRRTAASSLASSWPIPTRASPTSSFVRSKAPTQTPGVCPWHRARGGLPSNALTGRTYRGINIVALWCGSQSAGFADARWATFRQWSDLGAQVRQG